MSNIRALSLALLTATMVAVSASTVSAESPPLSVEGSPVAPGGVIAVAGTDCPAGGVVLIGLLDAAQESELAATSSTPSNGSWSAELQIGSEVRPGSYPLRARCTIYNGDHDGYSGYDGDHGGSFDYPPASVTVLPPATVPDGDASLSVTPDTLKVGDAALVTGAGWRSGEQVTIVLYSSPVVLTTTTTDAQGAIRVEVAVPPGTSLGAHDVVAMNASSALNPPLTLRASVTVIGADAPTPAPTTAPTPAPIAAPGPTSGSDQSVGGAGTSPAQARSGTLPITGSNPWTWIVAGVVLLAAGAVALRTARRPVET